MNNRIAKWATAAGAVAILTLSSGCARIQDVDAIQAELESLRGELASHSGRNGERQSGSGSGPRGSR